MMKFNLLDRALMKLFIILSKMVDSLQENKESYIKIALILDQEAIKSNQLRTYQQIQKAIILQYLDLDAIDFILQILKSQQQ